MCRQSSWIVAIYSALVLLLTASITPLSMPQNNSNLRANASHRHLQHPEAETALEDCLASCAVFRRPSRSSVVNNDESDFQEPMEACVTDCYAVASNGDAAVKSALDSSIPKSCAVSCTEDAASRFRPVSSSCDSKKSYKCSKCDDESECDEFKPEKPDADATASEIDEEKDMEKKYKKCIKEIKKCENELSDCKNCAREVSRARSSVKRISREFDKW